MKLSDLDPADVQPQQLKLSDIHPDDVAASPVSEHPVADKIENAISTLTPITPVSNNPHEQDLANIAGKIPGVGSYLKTAMETGSDMKRGLQHGISLGLNDEVVGGLKAAGKTGLEALTGELPEKKSAYEELLDNYKKYKGAEQQGLEAAKQRSPIMTGAGNIAGGFVPVGMALNAVKLAPLAANAAPEAISAAQNNQLLRNVATGAGLGATQSYGESDKSGYPLVSDVAAGAALGAGSSLIGDTVVAPHISKKIDRGFEYLKDQPWAKQLAATVQNKVAGGTLFGEKGTAANSALSKDLSTDIADALTDNTNKAVQQKTGMLTYGPQTFLQPKVDDFKTFNEVQDTLKNTFPQDFKNITTNDKGEIIKNKSAIRDLSNEFDDLYSGKMTPAGADDFRKQLKELSYNLKTSADISPSTKKLGQYIQNSGVIEKLENLSKAAGTDIKQLNSNISQSLNAVDPFVQKAGKILDINQASPKWASDSSPEKQYQAIMDTLNNLSNKGGRITGLGTDARASIAELQDILARAKAANPNLNINPAEAARKLQNQSYLNAAQQRVTGVSDRDPSVFGWGDLINPRWLAEKASRFSSVQDLSKKLLNATPAESQAAANALYSNPATKSLGRQLSTAATSGDSSKVNNTLFQLMQNPAAKKALGMNNDEDENH